MSVILFFSGAYALLTIIPRYIFPIMPFYLIMAAYIVADLNYRSRKFLWQIFDRKSSVANSSNEAPRL